MPNIQRYLKGVITFNKLANFPRPLKFAAKTLAVPKVDTPKLGTPKDKTKPLEKKKPLGDHEGNLRAGWLRGNIAHALTDPKHVGVNGKRLGKEERAYIMEQGDRRLAQIPKSTKANSPKKEKRFFKDIIKPGAERSAQEKDVIDQLTQEYAFSPAAIRKGYSQHIPSSVVPSLPRVNDIPGNKGLLNGEQKTFGQSPEDFVKGDSGYYVGAGLFTLNGKQYLSGQNVPQKELDLWRKQDPNGFRRATTLGDNIPGTLHQDKKSAMEYANSKIKNTPKGPSKAARIHAIDAEANLAHPLAERRTPQTYPPNFEEQLQDVGGDLKTGITRQQLAQVLPEDHIAHKIFSNDDMKVTHNALVNGLAAYNSTLSNNTMAGASAIGVSKKKWYTDSAKLFHGMFGLHENRQGPDHEENNPTAITNKVKEAYTRWEKHPTPKNMTPFLRNGLDSARFCAVLAATSPGISVKSNMVIALHIWDAWEEYKEKEPKADHKDYAALIKWVEKNKTAPLLLSSNDEDGMDDDGNMKKPLAKWMALKDPDRKQKELLDPELKKDKESVYGASILSALTGDDKKVLGLSTPLFEGGPKIENFRLACFGVMDKGVLDVWESYRHGVNQGRFSQKWNEKDNTLLMDADYKFIAAGFEEQAAILNKIQVNEQHPASGYYNTPEKKNNWEAADIQASGWSGLKGITEYAAFKGMTMMGALTTMTVGDMDKVEEFSNIGKEILHGTTDQDQELASFMAKTQSRHGNSPNASKASSTQSRAHKSLKELIEGIKRGGVSPETRIYDLIPKQLRKHAETFVNLMAVNHGSGTGKPFMQSAAGVLGEKVQQRKVGKLLKFAQFTPTPNGMTGTPAATRTNKPFANSIARSPGGKNLAQGALGNQINSKAGVETSAQNAIHDGPVGSEESIVHMAPIGTLAQKLKYLAAWHGISGQKKSMLVFTPNPNGPDAMYHIEHPNTDVGAVKEQFDLAGINYKTIMPGAKSTKVMVFDPNREKRNIVSQFATLNNLNVEENSGQGEIVGHNGDWNSAGALPKSRQAYQNIIGEYENAQMGGQPQPQANNNAVPAGNQSAGKAQQLSRKTTTKAKIKFDRSRRILEGFLRQHNTPNKELPPVGDLLQQDLSNIKPEHLSKYQQLVPNAKWEDIEGAVNSLSNDPSLYDDMTSESNRREMYCKEHARTVLQSSGLKKLIDSLQVQQLIPEHAQHLIEDAKDGDYFSLEAISAELKHAVPSLRAFSKAAEKEYNKAGKVWDKMRTPQPQKFAKKSAHAKDQYRAGKHGVNFRGAQYNGGQFAPKDDGVKRFEKDSNLTHMIKKLRGV
jgi:hypothetical protein